MSLQSRLGLLITAIGADIKALQAASPGTKDRYTGMTSTQVISGNADTYLSESRILAPDGKLQQRTMYRCKFSVVKTAAGVGAPVINVRVGVNGTNTDASRAVLTFAAQTAAIDEGVFEIECVFRQGGAAAVIQAMGRLFHRLVTTGLNVTATHTVVLNLGAAFDATVPALGIGLSINPGASAAWTVNIVSAELVNLAP